MSVEMVHGLPDVVSVQKRVYPLIFTAIVSEQPTNTPIATAIGIKRTTEADDGSGWSKIGFKVDRWFAQVKAHKLKTEITVEALTDMRQLNIGEEFVIDNIADQVADDINTEIITNLNNISTIGAGIALPIALDDFDLGRVLYSKVHSQLAKMEVETGCIGTYVVAGGKAFELLLGCGMVSLVPGENYYVCESGAVVVHDKYAQSDYFTVGVKKKIGEVELSSLVWSPYDYTGGTDGLAYQVQATDSKSLQPVYGVISRHACTVAPLETTPAHTGANEIDWSNLGALANSSKLSTIHAVTIA